MKTESVTVNSVMIDCPIENGVYYVAIRPICDALGIDYRKQFERIKSDPTQTKTERIMKCFACR